MKAAALAPGYESSVTSSIPKDTQKDFSELQILDTFEDCRQNGVTAPKDFMQSLDGSLERILKSTHGSNRPFLKKGHGKNGHINQRLKNWDNNSVSSFTLSKNSSRMMFDTQEVKNKKSTF
jgi:hypothetical protein